MTEKMTMKRIAELAGCSISQVSRVLNEKASVAPEVRERVRKIAAEHRFRVNITSHHVRLGFLFDEFGYFHDRLLAGVVRACAKRGWMLYAVNKISSPRELGEQFFDGFFCCSEGRTFQREWIKYQQTPLVMLNSYGEPGGEVCSVEPDPYDEGLQVLRHLKSLGHRKIARLNYCMDPMRGHDEFMAAARKLRLPGAVDVHDRSFSPERFLQDVETLTASGVTALFILHQSLAFRTVQLLKERGYRIPRDLSVVTYMRKRVSEFCDPPVTALDFDFDGIGDAACGIMALRLRGEPCPARQIRIPCLPLMIRDSTGPVRGC